MGDGWTLFRIARGIGIALVETVVDWSAQLDALSRGDTAALAQVRRLVTNQLSRMRAYQLRESWDDLAQEIVIRVWRAHRDGRIRDYAAFPGYVRALSRNAFIDATRKRQPEFEAEPGLLERTVSDPDEPLDPGLALALRNALEKLSERHREVVDRLYLRGLSYEETADDLNRPRGTINRLQREAMQQLRSVLLEGGDSTI